MTNTEMANYIAQRHDSDREIDSSRKAAALEMAAWKDQQFKEYLEKKHEEFTIKGTFENSYDWGRRSAIEEIINELYKED